MVGDCIGIAKIKIMYMKGHLSNFMRVVLIRINMQDRNL